MREGLRKWFGAIALGALGLMTLPSYGQEIVYDNMNPLAPNYQPQLETEEIGDDVTLGGTARIVNNFIVSLSSSYTQDYSGAFTARFYLPDGGDDGFGNPLPGTKIWEGTINAVGTQGSRQLIWTVPNITVPDNFIWSLQFDTNLPPSDPNDPNAPGIGLDMNDNPAIGSSQDLGYINDGTGWFAYNYGGDPVVNLQATIIADVPEPASMGALALGAVGMLLRRRR